MEILEQLKAIVKAKTLNDSVSKISELILEYPDKLQHLCGELIHVSFINSLIRELLDSDEFLGWVHVFDLFYEMKECDPSTPWYRYDGTSLTVVTQEDINDYLKTIITSLSDEITSEIRQTLGELYDVVDDLGCLYKENGFIEQSENSDWLCDTIVTIWEADLPFLTEELETALTPSVDLPLSTKLSKDLIGGQQLVTKLKDYHVLLNQE